MKFSGFNIYPIGNAEIEIVDGELKVSNVLESGFDGVLIDTKGLLDYTINFGDLSSIPDRNGVLNISTLAKNKLNQVVTSFESFKYCDRNGENIILGYNKNYLPKEFSVFGTLNGENVFDFDSSELVPVKNNAKIDLGTVALVIGIIKIGVTIWKELRTKEETTVTVEKDADGNITSITTTVKQDPVPFEVIVNNNTFTVDNVGIHFDKDVPTELIGDPSTGFLPIGKQITGFNLSEFFITSILDSKLK